MPTALLAYIPVLHQGYYQFFTDQKTLPHKDHQKASTLYVLTDQLAQEFTPVHKEIRALDHELIISAIQSWQLFENVISASTAELEKLNASQATVIIPNEVVTQEIAQKFLPECEVLTASIFLRWDKASALQPTPPQPAATISSAEVDQKFAAFARQEGEKTSDWWRQVGAVAIKNGEVVSQAHNTHLPSEQQPYAEGDPRAHFHKGDHIELTTAIHAEAKLIAEAAARGVSLAGAEVYVTDFPCPVCAKLIAFAGIKKVFYQKGYALLDGERVLHTAGIEIIQVI